MCTEMFLKNSHSIINRSSDNMKRNSNKINRTSNKFDRSSYRINRRSSNLYNQSKYVTGKTASSSGRVYFLLSWMIIDYHIKTRNMFHLLMIQCSDQYIQLSIFFTSGLAHLLEHTIFHASELFPTEGFSQFLRFERNLQTRLRSWR